MSVDDERETTTISLSPSTKADLRQHKRDGETWDLFLSTMTKKLNAIEKLRKKNAAEIALELDKKSKAAPTREELAQAVEMHENGEIDESTLKDLKDRHEKLRETEKDVFGR